MSGLSAMVTGGPAWSVVRSVGTIAAIKYLEPMVGSATSGILGGYTQNVAESLTVYLYFAAYSQGWITIPSTNLLTA